MPAPCIYICICIVSEMFVQCPYNVQLFLYSRTNVSHTKHSNRTHTLLSMQARKLYFCCPRYMMLFLSKLFITSSTSLSAFTTLSNSMRLYPCREQAKVLVQIASRVRNIRNIKCGYTRLFLYFIWFNIDVGCFDFSSLIYKSAIPS